MDRAAVVTCFLRREGEVLLFRRASDAGTYPGRRGTVTGYVEHEDPLSTARMEIREETALADFELARRGEPVTVRDHDLDREWTVHPFLFDAGGREVRTNEETATAEWTAPTAILRRETVPDLWRSYDRVRPTPETIAGDEAHGSAYLSIRALEVLRDEAGLSTTRDDGIDAVRSAARDLLAARPGMAALRNRVNRVLADAGTPSAVEAAAVSGIERAIEADGEAARRAAGTIEGHVLTLSWSGTVLDALRAARENVTVAESRPAREGIDAAESLADAGLDVRVCTDAAMARLLATDGVDAHENAATGPIDCVLVGADTVLPDGRVVNKTGTRTAAIAADRDGVPVYAVAATDKISTDATVHLESGPPEAVYDGTRAIQAANPTFDVTPAEHVAGVITERGVLSADDVGEVADELRDLAAWRDRER
jgi:translation initiation factor 2B subunit (eIF-2B alpha/beta/delta family)/8-oxo-dGTP pyrophosphatase MutT (NUDIX family)